MMHAFRIRSSCSCCCCLLLLIIIISCFSSPCSSSTCSGKMQVLGNTTDHKGLLDFKANIIHDPLGVLTSWNQSVHLCHWRGVTCGRRHARVVGLDLHSSALVGSISPSLGNLSFLTMLNLANNTFRHHIPHQVWSLGRLQQLILPNNSLSGVLLQLNISCYSSRLQLVHLSGNLLSGQIPDTLSCLSQLRHLRLWNNNLTGKLSPSLGNLSSLEILNLGANKLTGPIPESLGRLQDLYIFDVEQNRLSGSIPPSIFNLSGLQVLSLLDNRFNGTLPPELGTNIPYLEFLNVATNQFTGKIPPSISNATYLQVFTIADNAFMGTFPSAHKLSDLSDVTITLNHMGSGGEGDLNFLCSLVNATSLETLEVGVNNFGGEIPTCIGNLSSSHLQDLALEENNLHGNIPPAIGNLVNLEWFSVYENQLSGNIPFSIGSLGNIKFLFLNRNNFSGTLPSSFGNLTALNRLTLEYNNLHGSIPPSLGQCKDLIVLDVSTNKLNGSIPPQLFDVSPFSIGLYLSNNFLTGDFPSEVGSLRQIGELNVSQNLLSGNIPTSLGRCESLQLLDMSRNLFQGIIPPSLASLRGLQKLDLSHNNLTGEIPRFLASFMLLKLLNLSLNDFEGAVPLLGGFSNMSAIFLNDNDKLCGGIPKLHLPKCRLHQSDKPWKKIVLVVSVTLGIAIFVLTFILTCCLRRKGNKSRSSEVEAPLQIPNLSYGELYSATNGFSSANLIGVGSFGSVYKGILDQGGKLVAIKVLNLLRQGAYRTFLTECEALRNVRHRNLLKILTVCSSVDRQGKDFKALVCELMSNGSLEEWLHKKDEIGFSNQTQSFLTLLQRLDIATDVACALDYLHNECPTPIVHCDLKPGNVLLDDNMTAHLSDFGLAKFLPTIASGSSQSETSSIGVRGTIGYTPPEYGLGNEVSTFGDIYSYGVLLLEIFTGKRPTDEMFQNGLNLHQFAKDALHGSLWEIIDPTLLLQRQEPKGLSNIASIKKDSKMFHRIEECLIIVMGIGVTCSAELPRERMNIKDVVAQLMAIKEKLLQVRA